FDDDGPALDITASDNVLLLDESTGGAPNENDETLSTDPNDIGYAKLSASELFTLSTNAGADGEQSLSFQLAVNDSDSGLTETATGDAIVLSANENGTEVYGQNSSDGLVFKIVIDPNTGNVEVFQYSAIVHDNPSDPDEADTPKTLAQDALSLKTTLIDGDGDIAEDNFDLGQLIHFEDDGPVINADPPDNFEPWQSPDISHITLYWRQADDGHLEDTRGNGKDPDGWFTVKIDNYRGSPDLDDEIGRILDFLVSEEVIEESDKDSLVGVAIKGGQQELWYDYDTANSDPNSDSHPNDIPDFPIEKNELDMTYAWGDVLASGIPPSNTSSQQTITLDENDLSEENSLVSSGQIDISYGSDGVGGLTLSDSGAPDGYTYTLNQNATVLTVRDHETNTDVMKISIINAATGEYEVELLSPLTHPTSEDILSFNIGFTATDGDGDAVTGSFGINVINDGHPVAYDNKAKVDELSDYLNIYFVLDVSGSMGWKIDPVTGETIYSWWGPIEGSPNRLELAKEALVNLTEQYSNINGEALITVVPFSSGRGDNGAFASQTFNVLTPAGLQAAKDFINELDVGEGSLGTGTEYNDALNITREQLEADLANSALDNYENKVYFLSDGMPSPNAEAPASWQGFVDGNNIDVIPVGIGDFDTGGLVAVGNSGDEIIQVINPNELSAILENQISHIATGNVVTDLNSHGEIDTYGEDGHAAGTPLVISIEHNGVTYQFGDYSQNTDGHYVATIETELGGQLIFNFSTGDYQYTAPVVSGDNEERFEYTIQDADGDTASAFLTICIHDTSPPEFIVGTNVDDQDTSDTAYAVGDGKGTITGDGAGDILVGDTGGQEQTGKVANLAFVLDVSGSMNDNLGDSNQSKLDVLKTTMSNFLTQLSETENAAIRVHIVPFASIALAPQTFDISSGELTSALNYIEALEANGGTNYEAALGTANNWFSDPSHLLANADFQQTIFLTDGLPTLYTDGDSTDYTNENKVFGHGQHVEKVLIENLYGNHEGEEVTRDILNNIGETDSRDLDGRQDYVYDQDDDGDFETIPTTSDFIESVPDTYSEVDALKAHGPLRAISLENSEATTYLNNIDSEGQAYQVGSQELLQEILNDLSPLNSLNAAGDDRIIGAGGDDIIFGDSLYTDLLADNEGLNMPDGSGWAVFEELENNHADWDRQDTIDYINNHSDELAQQTVLPNGSGRAGGNDYIEGGAGNDHIYSQEGADTVDGGSGNNTIDLGIDSDADALIFNIETLDGNNTIINFDKNVDYLHFENVLTENSGGNIDDLDSLLDPENAFENTGLNNEDLTVNFQNGASITFVGVGLDASTMNSMQDITPNIVVNEISI
ncbi:von Willebrand factor type A domain-containing protein, partial [Legionella israelensis DSM 19235]